jgi:hypothetical protein
VFAMVDELLGGRQDSDSGGRRPLRRGDDEPTTGRAE